MILKYKFLSPPKEARNRDFELKAPQQVKFEGLKSEGFQRSHTNVGDCPGKQGKQEERADGAKLVTLTLTNEDDLEGDQAGEENQQSTPQVSPQIVVERLSHNSSLERLRLWYRSVATEVVYRILNRLQGKTAF